MTTTVYSMARQQNRLLLPIAVGGGVAGTLDMIAAFISFGQGMPRGIAAGLIGRAAAQTGALPWILGLVLHFFIAFSAATVYWLASRKLKFMRENWIVSGIFFGIGFYLVMYLIVLPLSAFHFSGPYQWRGMIQGLLFHMGIIGLPIAYSLRRFS